MRLNRTAILWLALSASLSQLLMMFCAILYAHHSTAQYIAGFLIYLFNACTFTLLYLLLLLHEKSFTLFWNFFFVYDEF